MNFFIYAFLFGVFLGFLKYIVKPIVKGFFGEKIVSARLSGLTKDKYILLNDVMIENDCVSTQIDHILVSVYGIFVIETKNYKGWIYGGEYSDQWTQNIYGHKNKFRNPLKQNYGHVKALMNLLGQPKESFIPVVVFSNSATLKVKTKQPVIYASRLKKYVLGYRDVLFTQEEIRIFESVIRTSKMDSSLSNRVQHVKRIKSNLTYDNQKAASGICPRCGGELVERKGKYGEFLGCSNYPNCRFTESK